MLRFVVTLFLYLSLRWGYGDTLNTDEFQRILPNLNYVSNNQPTNHQSNSGSNGHGGNSGSVWHNGNDGRNFDGHGNKNGWNNNNNNGNEESRRYYPEDEAEVMAQAHIKHGEAPYLLIMHPNPNVTLVPSKVPVYKWTFTAAEDCKPQITCTQFVIAPVSKDGICRDQYLEVTDGIAGIERFCGAKGPIQVVATFGSRDLYVSFKNLRTLYPAELECYVTCGQKDGSRELTRRLEPKINHKCFCGQKPHRDRIIGGRGSNAGEFPWIAAMVVANTRQPYCIGSVINDRMILTAGHCFKGRFRKANNTQIVLNGYIMDPMPNINVIKGTVKYMTYDPQQLAELDSGNNTFRFNVDKIIIHPLYNAVTSDFDTALMILSRPIDPSLFRTYSPICLPELKYDVDSYSGWTAAISGWGLWAVDSPGTLTEMKQITVDVYPPEECIRYFGDRFVSEKRVMCAAYPDSSQDSCAGDSGGPLILQYRPQVWYQIGIISWGDSCGVQGNPGVYFRTTSTNQWIRHISNSKEAVWCDIK